MAPRVELGIKGATGLNIQGGRVYEELLPELSGERWRRVVQEMVNDATIASFLFAIEMLVRQVEWTMAPADDSPEAAEIAAFADSCIHDMETTWQDTLAEILSFLPWGWAWFEIVYKRRGGPETSDARRRSRHDDERVGWRGWSIRAQETLLEWDMSDGELRGLWQSPPPDYARRYVPAEKSLHFRTGTRKGNPEGRSVLRPAHWPWNALQHIKRIEGIGIERDLAGLPVAHVPPSVLLRASAEDQAVYDAIKDIVTNIRRDEQEGVIWPLEYDANGKPLYELKLLSTGGTRQFDTDKVINRYRAEILMTVLADFIMLGHEKVGSFALSSDKTDLFATALGAFLDSIAATINAKAIPDLLRYNGMPMALCPVLTHGDIESANLEALGKYVAELSGAGVRFDEEQQRWLKEQAGMPVSVVAEKESEEAAGGDEEQTDEGAD